MARVAITSIHPVESTPDIPSPNAGDELDEFARYTVTDEVTSKAGNVTACSVGRPDKLAYFRAHPDNSMYKILTFLEVKKEKRTYLVASDLCDRLEFEGRTKRSLTVPWIDHHGAIGIWLVSIEYTATCGWVSGALLIKDEAQKAWINVVPITKESAYRWNPAKRDHGKPEWPDLDFSGWMRLAFPPEMRINDLDHPIAKMLRGE